MAERTWDMENIKDTELEDQILELQCNIDDMTGEELAFAMECIMEAGALDVFTIPIGMKKGRTGILLTVLCKLEQRKNMAKIIFQHTTTIGIRETVKNRMILKRNELKKDTSYGMVCVKQSGGYGVIKEKIEFDDVKQIAQREGKSIREIRQEISKDE